MKTPLEAKGFAIGTAATQTTSQVGATASLASLVQCFSRFCFRYARAAPQPDLLWDSCSHVQISKLLEKPAVPAANLARKAQVEVEKLSELSLMERSP